MTLLTRNALLANVHVRLSETSSRPPLGEAHDAHPSKNSAGNVVQFASSKAGINGTPLTRRCILRAAVNDCIETTRLACMSLGSGRPPALPRQTWIENGWRGKRAYGVTEASPRLACVCMAAAGGGSAADGREGDGREEDPPRQRSRLEGIIRRKQRILQARVGEMGPAVLERRLREARRAQPAGALVNLVLDRTQSGRTVIVAEVARAAPSESPESLARRCRTFVERGADTVMVCTDEELTPNGLADLRATCLALPGVPVLRKDWILHPLQVVETVEAGASGMHLVNNVVGNASTTLLGLGLHYGLDTIIEVVNEAEVEHVTKNMGIPLVGVNLSVSLSLALPGFQQTMAQSLLRSLPPGAAAVVGIKSKEEVKELASLRPAMVVVRREALSALGTARGGSISSFFNDLRQTLF